MWHSLLNVSAFRQQKDLKVANQQIMDDVHVLGIKIKEVDGGLAKVEWKFKLTKRRGRMTQAFKLPSDGFHPNSPQFNISCCYSTNRSGTCNGCYEFKVNFSLNQAKSPNQDDVQNQDKPNAILAIVDYNDSEKFPLMELQCSDKLNVWKSEEEIQIDASCCDQPDETNDDSLRVPPLFVTCKIWMHFSNFSPKKLKILKYRTNLFLKQTDCDVHFSFQDGQRIGAHKNVLMAKSPVFAAMFQHEMEESKTGRITIKDIDPDVFQQLLYFIYSGRKKTPLTEENVQPLFVAADKYDVKDLWEECIFYMVSSIRVYNAIDLMIFAHLYSIEELEEAAIFFSTWKSGLISQQNDFADFIKNYPDFSVKVIRRWLLEHWS